MSTGIRYNSTFEQFDAFIKAGATIEELDGLDKGRWDKTLVAKVVAWSRGRSMIQNSVEDAVNRASKKRKK